MPKILKFFTYLLSSLLTFSFLIILITENTNVVSHLYKEKIVEYIQSESQLRFNFDSLNIRWNGIYPNLIFNKISLYELNKEELYLDGNKLIVNINTLESLSDFEFKISGLNLVESKISLTYSEDGLFLKGYNLLNNKKASKESGFMDIGDIKFRISDSSINIKSQKKSNEYNLKNINLVLFYENNNIKLFTTFNHKNNNEVIHFASKFSLDDNYKINGKFYSQGLNINPQGLSFFSNKLKILSSKLNYTLWADIKNNSLFNLQGSLDIKNISLSNVISKNKIALKNLHTDLGYQLLKNKRHILFSNLNFSTEDSIYKDNDIHVTFDEFNLENIAIDKLYIKDMKNIINFAPVFPKKTIKNILKNIHDGYLSNLILLDLDDSKRFRYDIDFEGIEFINSSSFSMNKIIGNLMGSSKSGKLLIKGKEVEVSINSDDKFKLSRLNGLIFYKISNDKISLSSEELQLDDSHLANIYGSFSDDNSTYKINIKGDLDSLMNISPIKYTELIKSKNISLSSKYSLDYRFLKNKEKINSYGAINLSNLAIHDKQHGIVINSQKLRVSFFDKYIQSYETQYYINNNKYALILDTDIINNKIKYNFNSKGILTSDFIKSFSNNKLIESFKGSAPIDFKLTYQPFDKTINFKLNSNMEGMEFNILSPLNKISSESKNLEIKYILNNNFKKYINISYDVYKMKVSRQKTSLSISVYSPSIEGLINFPDLITNENRLTARLNYFNLNKFKGDSNPEAYSFLDLSIKKAKINDYYFNNVKIVTSPIDQGMMIDRFDFKNNDLSMKGNGKWIKSSDKKITFFDADFQSDNFGSSLKYLGYPGIIKEGNLSSRLIGQWEGSPENFSFNDFDGKIKLDLKDGEFLQVTKQTRAIGQLLGLFSISSLKKRLSLDFSDFFSSGLSFDTMTGEFSFSKAKAKTKDLLLKGTFGEMRINGVSDIYNRSHNQQLIYIPDLSSMSLISGTLLGGPIGALASIFYDKVLKEMDINTNQLAAVEYSIKGSWDEPEIKVIEPFKPIEN
ncbi:MAG: AsmA-like C-terminal region-containing protein [Gammaproteobacteria bacterium]|nr:AsmA-like C-terminal region-containing protein [Gammaproteobacteria bacterium]